MVAAPWPVCTCSRPSLHETSAGCPCTWLGLGSGLGVGVGVGLGWLPVHRWRAALALAVARRGDVLVLGRVQVGRRVAEHEALLLEAGEARAVGCLDVDDRVLRQVGAHLLRVRVRVKVGG